VVAELRSEPVDDAHGTLASLWDASREALMKGRMAAAEAFYQRWSALFWADIDNNSESDGMLEIALFPVKLTVRNSW
jgi:hypothetical protein